MPSGKAAVRMATRRMASLHGKNAAQGRRVVATDAEHDARRPMPGNPMVTTGYWAGMPAPPDGIPTGRLANR